MSNSLHFGFYDAPERADPLVEPDDRVDELLGGDAPTVGGL